MGACHYIQLQILKSADMKNSINILFMALIVSGCEKTIDLTYKTNSSRIVIEGNVSNQSGPYSVRITRSVSLPETGSYPTIDNALVSISDDAGNTETLAPRGNGLYQAAAPAGVEGRAYTLTVRSGDQTYTAQSTLPQRVSFDLIKIESIVSMGETEYNIIPVYTDPVAKGNNYRFVVSVNGKLVNQHFIQNDDVKNGVVNTQRLEINNDDVKLKPGDVVAIQMQCVDTNVALFYKTLALMTDSGPGGGTTPNNPPANISNGALGIFSAHTIEEKSVTIP